MVKKWYTCNSVTVAIAMGMVMPCFVSRRKLTPAGPIPAGAATPTKDAATWAKIASHSGSLTLENACRDIAEPTQGVNPMANAATIHHGFASRRAEPIASKFNEPSTATKTTTTITEIRTALKLNRSSLNGSSSSSLA